MALNDRQHVEGVAIMRRLLEDVDPPEYLEARTAAKQWLKENHPEPIVYMNAIGALAEGQS